jgi:hypothetical protein
MIKIDMWYNDKKEQATGLDIWFNDLGCFSPTACKKFVKRSHI